MHLFAAGLGYTAEALARHLVPMGWQVSGTTRSAHGAARLRACGFAAHAVAEGAPLPDGALDGATHLLVSAAPGAGGDPVLTTWGAAFAAHRGWQWIGYCSTTGVYADAGGGWVDEDGALAETGARAAPRLAAERAWAAFGARHGIPVQIVRLAGIYGPGRSAFDSLGAGTARRIVKPGQVFSRIHVDDIATLLAAAMQRAGAGPVFNVADDEPAPPQDVITFAAELMGIAPPPEEPFATARATMSPMALSFYEGSKRIANGRAKALLGWAPRYPTYREGLRAIATQAATGA